MVIEHKYSVPLVNDCSGQFQLSCSVSANTIGAREEQCLVDYFVNTIHLKDVDVKFENTSH